ncbi:uncharacterized protein [Physcomitrium patens]|uniref:uncharacterized protein isoform X2 n=1 Tax=Physcomitrium patens TaxID=3218 RepID=UPI000D16436F|nr:peptidyl-prolyl cis-trans isomerase cypE-like isoform X2 [Physcomitrium patens]|eukprot:XP_024388433.1 peptidyl-prolyl cis-trans isomerase cypE-like isoform X2 [Physcomitrella patens]
MAVILSCTHGTLEIVLFVKDSPRTCRNFLELCKAGYYDGTTFHKVIPGFMCQGGDPSGRGGESIYGPKFADEMTAKHSHDRKGIVSMANSGRNTNTSQFFILFEPSPHLDGKHTIFGQVKEYGFPVLNAMQNVKVKAFKPNIPIKLFVAEVIEDPWEGQELPLGTRIPTKPLVGVDQFSLSRCSIM